MSLEDIVIDTPDRAKKFLDEAHAEFIRAGYTSEEWMELTGEMEEDSRREIKIHTMRLETIIEYRKEYAKCLP